MSAGWNTIESDAGVFTYLLERLGVQDVQFEELVALEPTLLQQLSPLYGVIFLFKYPTDAPSRPTAPPDGTFDHDASTSLFFAQQVIQNACGTQALLSVLLNKDSSDASVPAEQKIEIGPALREFKDFVAGFPPDVRGEALSNQELVRAAHNAFARASPFVDETQRAAGDGDDVFHFIAYTSLHGRLYELDGLQAAPITHGSCTQEEFPHKVVEVLQRRIARYPMGEIRFNLLAMVRDLRIKAREIGDQEALAEQDRRRREWVWENALRRHNFVGFAGEVAKAVARSRLAEGEGAFERWVGEARERTRKRVEDRRARAGAGGGDEMDTA